MDSLWHQVTISLQRGWIEITDAVTDNPLILGGLVVVSLILWRLFSLKARNR